MRRARIYFIATAVSLLALSALILRHGAISQDVDTRPTPTVFSPLTPKGQDDGLTFKGHAVVQVQSPSVSVGDTLRFSVELHGEVHRDLYNPFVAEEHKLTGQLLITKADGTLARKLLSPKTKPQSGLIAEDWVNGGFNVVGREFIVRIDKESRPESSTTRERTLDLPPGEYYAQAIYSYWLTADYPPRIPPPPKGSDRRQPQPNRYKSPSQMDEPMLVSEPVKFVVMPRRAGPLLQKPEPPLPNCPLRVELCPTSMTAPVGSLAQIQFRIVNDSDETRIVYDPMLWWVRTPWRACKLVMLDAEGKLIGDLFRRLAGKSNLPPSYLWTKMPGGAFVSQPFEFRVGTVDGFAHWHGGNMLPPGKYFLELRVYDHILIRPWNLERVMRLYAEADAKAFGETVDPTFHERPLPPDEPDKPVGLSYEQWQRTLPGTEICRSNRIELEILPRTGD